VSAAELETEIRGEYEPNECKATLLSHDLVTNSGDAGDCEVAERSPVIRFELELNVHGSREGA
jgi:hypothetical protein